MKPPTPIRPIFKTHADKKWAAFNFIFLPAALSYNYFNIYKRDPKEGFWVCFILIICLLLSNLYNSYNSPTLQIFDDYLVGFIGVWRKVKIVPFTSISSIEVKYNHLIVFNKYGERLAFEVPKTHIESCKLVVSKHIIQSIDSLRPNQSFNPDAASTGRSLRPSS